jgi:hypothetical protein
MALLKPFPVVSLGHYLRGNVQARRGALVPLRAVLMSKADELWHVAVKLRVVRAAFESSVVTSSAGPSGLVL